MISKRHPIGNSDCITEGNMCESCNRQLRFQIGSQTDHPKFQIRRAKRLDEHAMEQKVQNDIALEAKQYEKIYKLVLLKEALN